MKIRLWEWRLLGSILLIDLILARCEGLRFYNYFGPLPVLGLGFLILLYGWIRRVEAFAEIGEYILLWVCFIVVNAISAYVVARWRLPLRDVELSGIDRTKLLRILTTSHWMQEILSIAYSSLLIQTLFSSVYFALNGFSDRNRELFRMTAIACIPTILISGIIPAVGPHPPLAPFQQALIDVRNPSSRLISVRGMQGIVTFPSFHTTMSVLFICAHRPPCRSFLPVLVLNLIMLIAIPFWGHHYFVDMIAGAAVALASYFVVKNWLNPGGAPTSGEFRASTAAAKLNESAK
jgi:membrane-associated phospholipid phosphatase